MQSPDLLPGEVTNLFEGDAELLLGEGDLAEARPAAIRVWFDWHAGLRVEVVADGVSDRLMFNEGAVAVKLPGGSIRLGSFSSQSRLGEGRMTLSGSVDHTVVGDAAALLDRIEFGLANMPPVSLFNEAVVVEADVWSLRIETVDDYRDRIATITAAGGGAVTHHCVVRRTDGSSFSWSQATSLMDAVLWVASFVTGTRVPVMFPIGVDAGGDILVREWGNVRRSRFGGVLAWCGDFERADAFAALLPAILHSCDDLSRQRRFRVALEFWLDAHLGSALETRLVAAVAGLELLAWEWLVDVDAREPDVVDRRKTADWRLRAMLELIGVPAAVPLHMQEVAASWPGEDGPKVVADLRHRVVHPRDLDALFQVSNAGRHDVLRLATWYLELALLRRLGYAGRYLSQVVPLPRFAGKGSPVPWAISTDAK